MNRRWGFLYHFLQDVESLQIFALCKDFDELSLEDNNSRSISNTSPYTYNAIIHSFLRSCTQSIWNRAFCERIRAPFLEFPRHFMDLPAFKSYEIRMALGFRFLPDQKEYLFHELTLPESFDRFSFLSNSLGLSYNSRALSSAALYPYASLGGGLRAIQSHRYSQTLVEVISYHNGRYGRFLVLVGLGVGCTVWYGFVPGNPECIPVDNCLFAPLESYTPFFDMQHYAPNFKRIGFVERNDVAPAVASAFQNDVPFAEISIPASGRMLTAIGLGVMVAFFLTVGIVPDINGPLDVQI